LDSQAPFFFVSPGGENSPLKFKKKPWLHHTHKIRLKLKTISQPEISIIKKLVRTEKQSFSSKPKLDINGLLQF
jgi:hypothetical protein